MVPPHRGQDEVRAALKRHIHPAVPERDKQTGKRQKIQRPRVLGAHFGRPAERMMERRADRADHDADDDRKQTPADKRAEIAPDAVICAINAAKQCLFVYQNRPPLSLSLFPCFFSTNYLCNGKFYKDQDHIVRR